MPIPTSSLYQLIHIGLIIYVQELPRIRTYHCVHCKDNFENVTTRGSGIEYSKDKLDSKNEQSKQSEALSETLKSRDVICHKDEQLGSMGRGSGHLLTFWQRLLLRYFLPAKPRSTAPVNGSVRRLVLSITSYKKNLMK